MHLDAPLQRLRGVVERVPPYGVMSDRVPDLVRDIENRAAYISIASGSSR